MPSLVGSEMCIRDRFVPECPREVLLELAELPDVVLWFLEVGESGGEREVDHVRHRLVLLVLHVVLRVQPVVQGVGVHHVLVRGAMEVITAFRVTAIQAEQ